MSAILCAFYFRKPKLMQLSKDSLAIDTKVLGKLLKLGISSFITQVSIAVITVVANNVVGTIGGENATDAGGALGIVLETYKLIIIANIVIGIISMLLFEFATIECRKISKLAKENIEDDEMTEKAIDILENYVSKRINLE